MNFKDSVTLAEAKKAQFQPSLPLQTIFFVAIYILSLILSMIISALAYLIYISMTGEFADISIDFYILLNLFTTIIPIGIIFLYIRGGENRSFRSMGFQRKGLVKNYAKGFFFGILIFAIAVLYTYFTGEVSFAGISPNVSIGLILFYLVGFLIQGMSEEVLLRGYFMVSLTNRTPILAAVLTNSLLFALMHIMNSGINLLSICNLFLFGVFASIYMLKTDQIWSIAAFHSAWNFVQGNIFGFPVSGIFVGGSLLQPALGENATIHGGIFGPEGGTAVTFALGIALVFIMVDWKKLFRELSLKFS